VLILGELIVLTLRCPGIFYTFGCPAGEGVKLPPTYISSSVAPMLKISTAIPMFSRSNLSMVLTVMSLGVGM